MREALDPAGKSELALPPSRTLAADLAAARWSVKGGRVAIESKDEVRARLGRSPDEGDAVVLAWWMDPLMVAAMQRSRGPRRRAIQYGGF